MPSIRVNWSFAFSLTGLLTLELISPLSVRAFCGDACPEDGRSYDDDASVISPPTLLAVGPACPGQDGAVELRGVVEGALVEVSVNGAIEAFGPFTFPNGTHGGAVVQLAQPFVSGDEVRARQTVGIAVSVYSEPLFPEEFSGVDVAPEVFPRPVWQCARLAASRGQPVGSSLTGYLDGTEFGFVSPSSSHAGIAAPSADGFEEAGREVTMAYEVCGDASPTSMPAIVTEYTQPIPALTLREGRVTASGVIEEALTAGARSIDVASALYGARLVAEDADTGELLGEGIAYSNSRGEETIPLSVRWRDREQPDRLPVPRVLPGSLVLQR